MSNETTNQTDESALVQLQTVDNNLPDNAFTKLPQDFKEAKSFCAYLASSKMVPKAYQGAPQDVFVALTWGQHLKITNPILALKNIAVVNGTPSLWGDLPIALVRNSNECEFLLEDNEAFAYARDKIPGWEHLKDKNPDDTSICVGKRKGEPVQAREFSKEDVKTASLGNVHKSYPKDMRKYRARARLIDSVFADVVMGFKQAEVLREDEKVYGGDHPESDTAQLNNSSMADNVLQEVSGKKAPKEAPDNTEEEVVDGEFEVMDDKPSEKPEPKQEQKEKPKKGKKATDEQIKYVLKFAKYLPDEDQKVAAKEMSVDNVSDEVAQKWLEEIRKHYKKANPKKGK